MNPGENNPSNNAGAAGVTPGSAPLDFTAPAGNSSVNSGLSMADSMAAAQDNLTSAGMAAPDTGNDALGLDQISSIDPTASMAASDQPLVPAAPVPGSIGSVTSVPPLPTVDMTTDTAGLGGTNSATTAPAAASNSAPSTNPFADTPATTIAEGAGGVGSALPSNNPVVAKASEPVQPYNPFAAQPGAMPASSSSEIPDALQPQVEKFSGDAGGKKSNLLTLILGGLALIFAVTTVIFVVLWMQAKDNVSGGNPIIIPPIDEKPIEDTLAIMTCSRDDGVGEGIEGFPEIQSMNHLVTANFKNETLSSLELANGFSFATPEAAEAMRGYFDSELALVADMGVQMGIEPITAEFNIDGYTVSERFAATPEKLIGDYIRTFMLTANAEGALDYGLEAIKANYEASGFVCQVE